MSKEIPFLYLHPCPVKRKQFKESSEKFKKTKEIMLAVGGGPAGVLDMLSIKNPSKSKNKAKRDKAALVLVERTLLENYMDELESKLIILTRRTIERNETKKLKAFHKSVTKWLKKNPDYISKMAENP